MSRSEHSGQWQCSAATPPHPAYASTSGSSRRHSPAGRRAHGCVLSDASATPWTGPLAAEADLDDRASGRCTSPLRCGAPRRTGWDHILMRLGPAAGRGADNAICTEAWAIAWEDVPRLQDIPPNGCNRSNRGATSSRWPGRGPLGSGSCALASVGDDVRMTRRKDSARVASVGVTRTRWPSRRGSTDSITSLLSASGSNERLVHEGMWLTSQSRSTSEPPA
jgi:hypothetical protein